MYNIQKIFVSVLLTLTLSGSIVGSAFAETVSINPSDGGTPVVVSNAGAFKPSVSISNGGDYVVAWVKDGLVEAKIYNPNDTLKGTVTVDTSTNLDTGNSAVLVKMNPISGDFIVVYNKKTASDVDLYYKVYDKAGSVLKDSTLLNSVTTYDQRVMYLDYDPLEEAYYVGWESGTSTINKSNIYGAKIMSSTGYPIQNSGVFYYATGGYNGQWDSGQNHSFGIFAKNVMAGDITGATNGQMYKYTWSSANSRWETTNDSTTQHIQYNAGNYGMSNGNLVQSLNNKMVGYTNKGTYYFGAHTFGGSNYNASDSYSSQYLKNGNSTSGWFTITDPASNKYAFLYRYYGDWYNSTVTPSLTKIFNLYNGGILLIVSSTSSASYSGLNVVYWNGTAGATPTVVTKNLLGTATETISAVDANLYGKIVTVKGD